MKLILKIMKFDRNLAEVSQAEFCPFSLAYTCPYIRIGQVQVKEELYYPSSENKGAGQLCSYCTADLCLCFLIGKNLFFS